MLGNKTLILGTSKLAGSRDFVDLECFFDFSGTFSKLLEFLFRLEFAIRMGELNRNFASSLLTSI